MTLPDAILRALVDGELASADLATEVNRLRRLRVAAPWIFKAAQRLQLSGEISISTRGARAYYRLPGARTGSARTTGRDDHADLCPTCRAVLDSQSARIWHECPGVAPGLRCE